MISKQILRQNLTLCDLLFYKKDLVPKLLKVLINSNGSLVKKSQLKKLNQMTPGCLITLKCLLQAYLKKIQKMSANKEVCRKLRLKTLNCLVNYFENA